MYYMNRRRGAPSAVEALCSRAMFLTMCSTELYSWGWRLARRRFRRALASHHLRLIADDPDLSAVRAACGVANLRRYADAYAEMIRYRFSWRYFSRRPWPDSDSATLADDGGAITVSDE